MVETCLFFNSLICLPTGLGKTFIALNVILNYYKWFPKGFVIFFYFRKKNHLFKIFYIFKKIF